MAIEAASANPIQISLVLDSGVFLNELSVGINPYCRVGYFTPQFRIYADRIIPKGSEITLAQSDGRLIEVRLIDAGGAEKKGGLEISSDLHEHLLLRQEIYKNEAYSPPVIETRFDWIFSFNSGFFRCSSVKNRFFKQVDGRTHQPNGKRREYINIAHDVVVHYELTEGERLEIAVGDNVLWTTSNYPDVKSRFDIEVIGPHATAENYFRDALDHKGNDYWIPNQGDPGPVGGKP